MKKSEIKQIVREEILKEFEDVKQQSSYDPSLLGPQIMNAAKEYARDKSNNPNEEKALMDAFIAGILWKTK
jgi:hypothetical protein